MVRTFFLSTPVVIALVYSLCCSPASAQVTSLTFRPSAIEYSSALDKLVMTAGAPNQLHIYDPNTNGDTTVNLPLPPLSLSVSLDGIYAAVGHDSYISYVDLAAGRLLRVYPISTKATSIVLGAQFAYVLPSRSLNLGTGMESNSVGYSGEVGRLHPGGKWIYGGGSNSVQRLDVSTGPLSSKIEYLDTRDHRVCGNAWFSADGARVFNCGATAFEADSTDFRYVGGLNIANQIASFTHSAELGKILLITSGLDYYPPKMTDAEIQIYDYDYLTHAGKIALPSFTAGGQAFAAHGRFVSYSSDSKRVYVVMQADPSSGINQDFAVQVLQWRPADNCRLSTGASGVSSGRHECGSSADYSVGELRLGGRQQRVLASLDRRQIWRGQRALSLSGGPKSFHGAKIWNH
jgi:hypothetical protein